MNVFGSSVVGETKKIIVNLEISNKKMKNELDTLNNVLNVQKDNVKTLEEIIKTNIEDTVELKNKMQIIEKKVDYTENYISEVISLLQARDSEYFKGSLEIPTEREARI
jgi:uncharacterized protein YwgA